MDRVVLVFVYSVANIHCIVVQQHQGQAMLGCAGVSLLIYQCSRFLALCLVGATSLCSSAALPSYGSYGELLNADIARMGAASQIESLIHDSNIGGGAVNITLAMCND